MASVETFIKEYTKAVRDGVAAVFAGAGLSRPAGFVDWKQLLASVAEELDLDIDSEHDLVALGQFHINKTGGRGKLNQLLMDEFNQDATLTASHRALAALPVSTYWTTNYDDLIERSLREAGKIPDVKVTVPNLAVNLRRRDAVVYKMHGDAGHPNDAVISRDDYERYEQRRGLFTVALRGDLVSKTFLFVGLSFTDPNVNVVLSRVRLHLEGDARPHYALFKRPAKSDTKSGTDEEFGYLKARMQHHVDDLKRFGVQTVYVEEYADIPVLLDRLRARYSMGSVFVSGAAAEYGRWSEVDALEFVHALSRSLAESEFRIATGFGVGIGSAVINGVLEHVFKSARNHVDDFLQLRPFPQTATGGTPLAELWTRYREEMVSTSGVAVFLFGNKAGGASAVVESNGMIQEFEIAVGRGLIPIPVGTTGYASRTLWERVMKEPGRYYGDRAWLVDAVRALGDDLELGAIHDALKAILIRLRDKG